VNRHIPYTSVLRDLARLNPNASIASISGQTDNINIKLTLKPNITDEEANELTQYLRTHFNANVYDDYQFPVNEQDRFKAIDIPINQVIDFPVIPPLMD